MRDLTQVAAYLFGVVIVSVGLCASVYVGVSEFAQIVPLATASPRPLEGSGKEAEPVQTRAADANPVWIAATPKYQYDPNLMEVKPRNELRRAAELRRQQDHQKHLARIKIAKAEAKARRVRRLREAREAFAYAPEQSRRPDFLMFPFIR